jgi:acyl-CoA thioester hydrolase
MNDAQRVAEARMAETYRGAVYPWHCDHMGHMNVMWYVGKFDEATWNLFTLLGLPPSFLRHTGRGMAAVDQRIAYLSELHAGDIVVVKSGVLEARDKVLRFFHVMRNDESGEIAAITQLTAVHLDKTTRKSAALPVDVTAKARERIVEYGLPW